MAEHPGCACTLIYAREQTENGTMMGSDVCAAWRGGGGCESAGRGVRTVTGRGAAAVTSYV